MHITEEYVIKNQKKLRCGITTGTCATAAAKAAATKLLLGETMDKIVIHTPKEITVSVPVFLDEFSEENGYASFYVIKDSGDDPDVTNHSKVYVRVEYMDCEPREQGTVAKDVTKFYSDNHPSLILDGGLGIGRVTKEGLEQGIGQAAINTVPRRMIFQAVQDVLDMSDYTGNLLITVSIPEGVELSKKTFNPKLGIEGGLSVLGTSGILEPMSEQAIVATIETEIKQIASLGRKSLLVTPGNYGQVYASEYLGLDLSKSVKSSNYVGDTIDYAVSYGFEEFLLVGNIGKLVKLAAGVFNTHSKIADSRHEVFVTHIALCGGSKEICEKIMECINTEAMLDILKEENLFEAVINSICKKIDDHVKHRAGGEMKIGVALFSEKHGFLGMTEDAKELIDKYKAE